MTENYTLLHCDKHNRDYVLEIDGVCPDCDDDTNQVQGGH